MNKIRIRGGNLQFCFLNSGDLYEACHGNIMLNQLRGNNLDGSLNNLYLRVWKDGKFKVYPLLGVQSSSVFCYSDSSLLWQGKAADLQYTVQFFLTSEGVWFWDVRVSGSGAHIDVVYGQDISLANQDAVLNNEAYISQYIDHSVFEDGAWGYVVCSRQNQPQPAHPFLQQGCLTGTVGYSTDGFQFFGLDYKEQNRPTSLFAPYLANEVYQYEFAYIALQSQGQTLQKQPTPDQAQFVFYGLFQDDHSAPVMKVDYQEKLNRLWEEISNSPKPAWNEAVNTPNPLARTAPLRTQDFSFEEIAAMYPHRQHEEWRDHKLLSFFDAAHNHIVLRDKELLVERSHGHILMSGHNDRVTDNTITTTCYMNGIFNAQLSVGNTSFNKFLSNVRNHLNIFKSSGQRIFVELGGELHLLTLPSAFEMGFNYARWYYKTSVETFIITNYTLVDAPEVRLVLETASGTPYNFVVTSQVIVDQVEYQNPYRLEKLERENGLLFRAGAHALNTQIEGSLAYKMVLDRPYTVEEDRDSSLVILKIPATANFNLVIQGMLHGEELNLLERDFHHEVTKYNRFFQETMNGFSLSIPGKKLPELERLNTLVWWYTHNMLVHFSVPRGLEQYSGGGWGTRDVVQGPAEYFLATQNYSAVKEILRIVYSRQFLQDGGWPQWFMFDGYYRIQAGDSHGDIVVWPLKLLGQYLTATEDFAFLDEPLPYMCRDTMDFTGEKSPVLKHLQKQIEHIKGTFLPGTFLSSYGDGDWDDTLQPANGQLRKYMVSSWTVALTYQALGQIAVALARTAQGLAAELRDLASHVAEDFAKYILSTDVIPGFVFLEDLEHPEFMLHPTDNKTGIHYRLLPQTRSIISELVDKAQAIRNVELIKEHLFFPDGVRLMNRPATYSGGVSEHFQRAERAANFGREIGLQYVHAHIRFIEAMAKLGKGEDAWEGLSVVNPITLRDVVPNAELRQSNAYFSSSDGQFATRYVAAREFHKLREGKVGVKGGWRIYSSGPGIYFNQVVSNCLGIRYRGSELVIDPVLPKRFDGLRFNYTVYGKPVEFIFHLNEKERGVTVNGQRVTVQSLANPYRSGGGGIQRMEVEKLLRSTRNTIDVFLKGDETLAYVDPRI